MVEQCAQLKQRRHAQTRRGLVVQLPTENGIQHPNRHNQLHCALSYLHDDAVPDVTAEPTDDLHLFARERMVTIVDRCEGRFMGSMTMPCGTASPRISWKAATTFAPYRSYLAIEM